MSVAGLFAWAFASPGEFKSSEERALFVKIRKKLTCFVTIVVNLQKKSLFTLRSSPPCIEQQGAHCTSETFVYSITKIQAKKAENTLIRFFSEGRTVTMVDWWWGILSSKVYLGWSLLGVFWMEQQHRQYKSPTVTWVRILAHALCGCPRTLKSLQKEITESKLCTASTWHMQQEIMQLRITFLFLQFYQFCTVSRQLTWQE